METVTISTEIEVNIYQVIDSRGTELLIDYVTADSDGDLIVHLLDSLDGEYEPSEVRDYVEENSEELLSISCNKGLFAFLIETMQELETRELKNSHEVTLYQETVAQFQKLVTALETTKPEAVEAKEEVA